MLNKLLVSIFLCYKLTKTKLNAIISSFFYKTLCVFMSLAFVDILFIPEKLICKLLSWCFIDPCNGFTCQLSALLRQHAGTFVLYIALYFKYFFTLIKYLKYHWKVLINVASKVCWFYDVILTRFYCWIESTFYWVLF